jgi:hypothetical protein
MAESTLSIGYDDLQIEVGRFLGYSATVASWDAGQVAEVDRYIQAGVRQFYYPPATAGAEAGYEWSFLKPVATIQTAIDDAPGIGSLNTNSKGTRKDLFAGLSRTIGAQDVAAIPYAYAAAAEGSTATGASGSLDQLAVLTQIGAGISARSDTFRVRAYGEAMDRSGKVAARAWCEAVIQRVPEYVLGDGSVGNEPWDESATIQPINRAFGRRFVVQTFRLLTENEI